MCDHTDFYVHPKFSNYRICRVCGECQKKVSKYPANIPFAEELVHAFTEWEEIHFDKWSDETTMLEHEQDRWKSSKKTALEYLKLNNLGRNNKQ